MRLCSLRTCPNRRAVSQSQPTCDPLAKQLSLPVGPSLRAPRTRAPRPHDQAAVRPGTVDTFPCLQGQCTRLPVFPTPRSPGVGNASLLYLHAARIQGKHPPHAHSQGSSLWAPLPTVLPWHVLRHVSRHVCALTCASLSATCWPRLPPFGCICDTCDNGTDRRSCLMLPLSSNCGDILRQQLRKLLDSLLHLVLQSQLYCFTRCKLPAICRSFEFYAFAAGSAFDMLGRRPTAASILQLRRCHHTANEVHKPWVQDSMTPYTACYSIASTIAYFGTGLPIQLCNNALRPHHLRAY